MENVPVPVDMALRCCADTPVEQKYNRKKDNYSRSQVLVLDTETTVDQYQNLKFGSCCLYINGKLDKTIIFYSEDLKEDEVKTLKDYTDKHQYILMSQEDFVGNIFFPKAYHERARVVGFNLPFDLSRLAIHYGESMYTYKNPEEKKNV